METLIDTEATTEPEPSRPRWRWRRLTILFGVLVVLGVAGAALVPVPYYAIAPGAAVSTRGLVDVPEGPSFPPEGEIFLATVTQRELTLVGALQGWLDPAVDVFENETLGPDVDFEELRRFNVQLMDQSKEAARGVAFEQLGYDAISSRGAEIREVVAGSPADGLLRTGDTIVQVDDEPVRLDSEAVALLGDHRPGDVTTLGIDPVGRGRQRSVEVTLGRNPEERRRPFLGVSLSTRVRLDFPYEVDIQSERIGGPSAGLAFTLQVLDLLTEGELTGGNKVAATGTIGLDGAVGDVGGVAQKTVAVENAGADVFLVPSLEYDEALSVASDDLRVEAVDTLQEALAVLADMGGNGLALERPGDARA